MRSKYNNRVVYSGGEKFDSQSELDRWRELKLLERAGMISNLRRQVSFELVPAVWEEVEEVTQLKTKTRIKKVRRCRQKAVTYIADYVYTEMGKEVVEDRKGCKTKEYLLKKKMMYAFLGISIKETR